MEKLNCKAPIIDRSESVLEEKIITPTQWKFRVFTSNHFQPLTVRFWSPIINLARACVAWSRGSRGDLLHWQFFLSLRCSRSGVPNRPSGSQSHWHVICKGLSLPTPEPLLCDKILDNGKGQANVQKREPFFEDWKPFNLQCVERNATSEEVLGIIMREMREMSLARVKMGILEKKKPRVERFATGKIGARTGKVMTATIWRFWWDKTEGAWSFAGTVNRLNPLK